MTNSFQRVFSEKIYKNGRTASRTRTTARSTRAGRRAAAGSKRYNSVASPQHPPSVLVEVFRLGVFESIGHRHAAEAAAAKASLSSIVGGEGLTLDHETFFNRSGGCNTVDGTQPYSTNAQGQGHTAGTAAGSKRERSSVITQRDTSTGPSGQSSDNSAVPAHKVRET